MRRFFLLVFLCSCSSSSGDGADVPPVAAPPPPGDAPPPGADPPPAAKPPPPPATFACVTTFPEAPRISLPKDEARHGDFFEWWYWTGHLATGAGKRFGFQLTFFESTPSAAAAFASGTMAHFTVTDHQDQSFHHDYRFAAPASYPQQTDRFHVANETWWADGTSGKYTMHAEAEGYTLDLSLEDEKRAVMNFGSGFTSYPDPYAGYTYYDSRPRLRATGTMNGEAVSGEVWMDQQWGQPPQTPQPFPLPPIIERDYGWQWFQFQLDSGEELMLLEMHVKGAKFLAGGTWVGKDCSFESLDPSAFVVTPLGSWKSPHTGATYPQNWHVELPAKKLAFDATVVVSDQEVYKHTQANPLLAVATPAYWEGEVTLPGGRGYAEVVGTPP
jgi:predicted secreted hydrolase